MFWQLCWFRTTYVTLHYDITTSSLFSCSELLKLLLNAYNKLQSLVIFTLMSGLAIYIALIPNLVFCPKKLYVNYIHCIWYQIPIFFISDTKNYDSVIKLLECWNTCRVIARVYFGNERPIFCRFYSKVFDYMFCILWPSTCLSTCSSFILFSPTKEWYHSKPPQSQFTFLQTFTLN